MRILLPSLLSLLAVLGAHASEGLHSKQERAIAAGPKMTVVSATYWGAASRFVGGAQLADGSFALFGDLWGPKAPGAPRENVLGQGSHSGGPVTTTDDPLNPEPHPDSPDVAGCIVLYSANLGKVTGQTRFGWGVASIAAGGLAPDGNGLIIVGRAGRGFSTLTAARSITVPGADGTAGDAYAMRLDRSATKIEWIVRLPGQGVFALHRKNPRHPDRLWFDSAGTAHFQLVRHVAGSDGKPRQSSALVSVSVDGTKATVRDIGGNSGTCDIVGVGLDGACYLGGDRNTRLGLVKGPWRQPYCYRFEADGKKSWSNWEWDSKTVPQFSDSSIRAVAADSTGDLVVAAWSDGGNTVLRYATDDVNKEIPCFYSAINGGAFKGARGNGWLLRVDAKSGAAKEVVALSCCLPDAFASTSERDKPGMRNSISLDQLAMLAGDALAIQGSAATGLVQTPERFYQPPAGYGGKMGGNHVIVLSKDLRGVLFSSYVPACDDLVLAPVPGGLLVLGWSRGEMASGDLKLKAPLRNPAQNEWMEPFCGHAILLRLP